MSTSRRTRRSAGEHGRHASWPSGSRRSSGTVTWDLLPALDEEEPWFDAARKLRLGLDLRARVGAALRRHAKTELRARDRAPRLVRWAAAVPLIGPPAVRTALMTAERLLPRSEALERYLRSHAPGRRRPRLADVLTFPAARSVEGARKLQLPVAAAIMSWDHLSSKALVHLAPDRVLVWNDVQRQEAIDMHGLPAERIVVTGAQCYDQWFTREPDRTRDAFCRAMGLRADRPFALWVHSALSPTPEPPEPVLVDALDRGVARQQRPAAARVGRPRAAASRAAKEWAGVDLSRFDNVAFYGGNPIDARAKSDYFDALHYSSAVIGLVTSAFLEAAIVGRPVLTFTLPEYRVHQEEMAHFRYLTEVAGGLLRHGAGHRHSPRAARRSGQRGRRPRRAEPAVPDRRSCVPQGLDEPATPRFVDALERLHRDGTQPDPSLERTPGSARSCCSGLVRHANGRRPMADARCARRRLGRAAGRKRAIVQARIAAKTDHQRLKQQRRSWRRRRDAVMRGGKRVKSALMTCRYYAAVTLHRALALVGKE
jgi:hypothetical protein